MAFYTITEDTDNIAAHSSAKEAERVRNSRCFDTEAKLTTLAAEWPTSRLIRIWNSLPGVVPVTRFTSRKLALTRIWNSIQTIGDPNRDNHPATRVMGARSARTTRKRSEISRPKGSRTEAIIALLKRPEGATLKAMMDATNWQAHSVRGFLSGIIRKKMNFKVIATKTDDGLRIYRVRA